MHATKHCSKVHGSQKAFLQHSTKPSEKQQKDLCLRSSCFHPVVVLVLVSKTRSVICGAVILSSSAIHRSIGHCSIALPFSVLRFHLFHAFISNRSEKTGIAFYILHILSFLYKSSNKLWYQSLRKTCFVSYKVTSIWVLLMANSSFWILLRGAWECCRCRTSHQLLWTLVQLLAFLPHRRHSPQHRAITSPCWLHCQQVFCVTFEWSKLMPSDCPLSLVSSALSKQMINRSGWQPLLQETAGYWASVDMNWKEIMNSPQLKKKTPKNTKPFLL